MDLGPKLRAPVSYATTTRVLVIFLAIALGLLYQRVCHTRNELMAMHEVLVTQQVENGLNSFILESTQTKIRLMDQKVREAFNIVDRVLNRHADALTETIVSQGMLEEKVEEQNRVLEIRGRMLESISSVVLEAFKNTSLAFPRVIKTARPGVVGVACLGQDHFIGSGALIDRRRGYVLTARHVVDYGNGDPDFYFVRMFGEKVRVVSSFLDTVEDLAILIVDVDDPNYAPSIEMALAIPGSAVRGQLVLSLGHPYGLRFTACAGIVSNPDSEHINFALSYGSGVFSPRLQFDAAINPGNSGGPVINLDGKIEGICVSIQDGIPGGTSNSGVGFAVPVSEILKSLKRFAACQLEKEDDNSVSIRIGGCYNYE